MNKTQFLQLVLGTIETAFEGECQRQGVANIVARNDLSVIPDRESLIRSIVFGISNRFSDQYEADLESLIRGDVALVKEFDIKRISRRIMKSRVAQQYLIGQRLKQFGSMSHFKNKQGIDQILIKGATTDFVYASQHRSNAVLKLLRSQWPHLLGIEGRFAKRDNRSNQKLQKINVGGGNIGCEYMGFVVYSEHYSASTHGDVLRIKLTKKPGQPVGLGPKEAELYKSILNSLAKMFRMMHIVRSVEVDTSCLVVVLKKGEFMKSPLELNHGANVAVDAIKDKLESRHDALKAMNAELETLKKRQAELDKQVVWTESDIKTLNKALEIMML